MMGNVNIKINNKEYNIPSGITVHQAASSKGIDIPVMCENEELEHFSSCMVCLVKDSKNGKLFPSCSMTVQEGMEIITEDEEVLEARKISLELLLSEHVGDCEAPCVTSCPAHMDIPEMNRLLVGDKYAEALKLIKNDIALPAVLGRICPAPCEAACRRKGIDGAVSICLLKRFAGDTDLNIENPFIPELAEDSGRKVAIIGGGPAGLSATYYLRKRGHAVSLFEKNEKLGGDLRVPELSKKLPEEVLDNEIRMILRTKVDVQTSVQVEKKMFESILTDYDAVIFAIGHGTEPVDWGVKKGFKGFEVSKPGYQTSNPKVFAVGGSIRESKMAIRALAQGKEVAFSVDQFFGNMEVIGEPKVFNSRFGKLVEKEHLEYLKESIVHDRIEPTNGIEGGLTAEEVKTEASRCMHCDCRKKNDCTLRDLSDKYDANQRSFTADSRVETEKHIQHKSIVYEPAKCIKCGICVRLTKKYGEKYGLSFIGRGFDVRIGVPFNEGLEVGLQQTAIKVAEACPTGALSKK